jgi:hypothetical protein
VFVGSPFPSNASGLAFPGETSAGAADAFIRKYDGNGNEVWTDQFGSTAFDGSFGVAVDAGGVFVVGECRADAADYPRGGSAEAEHADQHAGTSGDDGLSQSAQRSQAAWTLDPG